MPVFKSADFLIPPESLLPRWAVIACDQFTSEKAYWERVSELVGDAPSALKVIFPEAYLGEELRKSVNAFLHTLSARDCDLFLRRYFYAEDAAQLARSFGLKEANVRLILSRTRKKLKRYLKEEGLR